MLDARLIVSCCSSDHHIGNDVIWTIAGQHCHPIIHCGSKSHRFVYQTIIRFNVNRVQRFFIHSIPSKFPVEPFVSTHLKTVVVLPCKMQEIVLAVYFTLLNVRSVTMTEHKSYVLVCQQRQLHKKFTEWMTMFTKNMDQWYSKN